MKDVIYIDCDFDLGRHALVYHVLSLQRGPQNQIRHPEKPDELLDVIDFLLWLNADKTRLEKAGFLEFTKIPRVPTGTTRWHMVVEFAQSPDAPTELKVLTLT